MKDIFNLGTFLKFLGKNKTYTAIDIFGLAVSLMFVILIAVYAVQELSTDKFHEKADRIYVLGNQDNLENAYRIAGRIRERYPEIEQACPIISNGFDDSQVSIGDVKLDAKLLFADSTFFDMFSFKLHGATPNQVLAAKNQAIVSKTFALKAFGNEDPLGREIKVSENISVIVNGIMDDIKNSTIPYGDILLRIDNIGSFNSTMDSETFDNAGNAYIFLLEKEGANLRAKADDMEAFFKEIFWIYKREMRHKVTFTPLQDVYFSDTRGSGLQHGDRKFVTILMSVGLLILLFAVINYINLTVAQAGFRAREMAMRRLLGSTHKELFTRLILESVLLCFIAFFLALLLAALCVPYADKLLETKLDIAGSVSFAGVVIALGAIALLGMISGWLPASIISKTQPLEIAKGSFGRKNKMVFSRFFIIFQHIITVMLLVAAITMTAQTLHLIHAPLGYNTVNILDTGTSKFDGKGSINACVNELKQLTSVKQVGLSMMGTPFNPNMNLTMEYEGKNLSVQILVGDTAFFEMLGLQKIRENNLASAEKSDNFWALGNVYLSQQALKEAELNEDAPKFAEWPIAGIIKDFQTGNITHQLFPILFFYSSFEDENRYPGNMLIEIQGDLITAYSQVAEVYKRITGMDFEGKFIDQQVAESFAAQKRTATIIILFSVIAVVISLLGLLAMSTYFIRQRTKEIALRKVHGADNFKVLSQLVWVFLGYVVIAFVIAAPIIGYFMQKWLEDYSYRISLIPWIFIAAGGFCLLVSFVTVYWQSRIAANANPVKALKSE